MATRTAGESGTGTEVPTKPRVIDTDVHHGFFGEMDLLPYVPEEHRERFEMYGLYPAPSYSRTMAAIAAAGPTWPMTIRRYRWTVGSEAWRGAGGDYWMRVR